MHCLPAQSPLCLMQRDAQARLLPAACDQPPRVVFENLPPVVAVVYHNVTCPPYFISPGPPSLVDCNLCELSYQLEPRVRHVGIDGRTRFLPAECVTGATVALQPVNSEPERFTESLQRRLITALKGKADKREYASVGSPAYHFPTEYAVPVDYAFTSPCFTRSDAQWVVSRVAATLVQQHWRDTATYVDIFVLPAWNGARRTVDTTRIIVEVAASSARGWPPSYTKHPDYAYFSAAFKRDVEEHIIRVATIAVESRTEL